MDKPQFPYIGSLEDLNADIIMYKKMIKRNKRDNPTDPSIKDMEENLEWLNACKETNHIFDSFADWKNN